MKIPDKFSDNHLINSNYFLSLARNWIKRLSFENFTDRKFVLTLKEIAPSRIVFQRKHYDIVFEGDGENPRNNFHNIFIKDNKTKKLVTNKLYEYQKIVEILK